MFYSKTGQTDKILSPFDWNICTRNLVSMAVIGAVSWIFTLLLEYEFFNHKKYKNCCVNSADGGGVELQSEEINQNIDIVLFLKDKIISSIFFKLFNNNFQKLIILNFNNQEV